MKPVPCWRCGKRPVVTIVTPGYLINCSCGWQTWSAGTKSEAIQEWNAQQANERARADTDEPLRDSGGDL